MNLDTLTVHSTSLQPINTEQPMDWTILVIWFIFIGGPALINILYQWRKSNQEHR